MTTGEQIHGPGSHPWQARVGVMPLFRAAVLAAMVGVAAMSATAGATTMMPMTIEQFTDASTYIVEGKVTEVWTELDTSSGMVWTNARVAVTTTYKGPASPSELIVSSAGGEYGDYSVWVPSMAVFSVDEDVFLFLAEIRDGRLAPVSKFAGKYTVRRAPGERESYVRTWEPARLETFDARFLPHPAVANRFYLSDLREQVRSHLAEGWDGKPIPGLAPSKLSEINTVERRSR